MNRRRTSDRGRKTGSARRQTLSGRHLRSARYGVGSAPGFGVERRVDIDEGEGGGGEGLEEGEVVGEVDLGGGHGEIIDYMRGRPGKDFQRRFPHHVPLG